MNRRPATHGVISGVLITIVGTAKVWGLLQTKRDRAGLNLPALDGQIAAIAHLRGLVVVTRNTGDFEGTGVRVLNPFEG